MSISSLGNTANAGQAANPAGPPTLPSLANASGAPASAGSRAAAGMFGGVAGSAGPAGSPGSMGAAAAAAAANKAGAAGTAGGAGKAGAAKTSGAGSGDASASNKIGASLAIKPQDFLKLITAQMKDQNPLSPSDPTQFLSQLEGMSEVSSMQGLQSSMQQQQVMSGTSLLGREVLAPSSTATTKKDGDSVTGGVNAPAGATALTVTFADPSGTIVSSQKLTPTDSGTTTFTWDGTNMAGTAAKAGNYTVSVNAVMADGSVQKVSPMLRSSVSSVTMNPSSNALDVNTSNGTVPLSSVVNVW